MKKNNKGFSLVELIVVILIMAIIAVALAPQVMKWVDKSKVNTDINNRANLKSSMDAAVADYFSQGKSFAAPLTFTVDGTVSGLDSADTAFKKAANEVLNDSWPEFESTTDGYFKVTISEKGVVAVEVYKGVSGEDYNDGRGVQSGT